MPKIQPENYAERIKKARAKCSLTQAGAAEAWKISRRTLEYWEQGRSTPRGLYRDRIEQILKEIEA